MVTKDLGMVTAYAYAVAGGYTGTEAEFTQLMADLAVVVDDFDNFSVNVTTLPAGSSATASYSDGVLSLGIPKGDKGDKGNTGNTPDFGIGTVTTLSAGSSATASITGTAENPVLNLGIPEGQAGSGAVGTVASAYSSSSTYAVGDYVIHNSNLYRCTTAITTAEAFTAAHWTQVVLGDDVSDLKSELSFDQIGIKNISSADLVQGNLNGSTLTPSADRLSVNGMVPVYKGMKINFVAGTKVNQMYLRKYDSAKQSTGNITWSAKSLEIDWNGFVIVLLRDFSGSNITPSDFDAELSFASVWHQHASRDESQLQYMLNGLNFSVDNGGLASVQFNIELYKDEKYTFKNRGTAGCSVALVYTDNTTETISNAVQSGASFEFTPQKQVKAVSGYFNSSATFTITSKSYATRLYDLDEKADAVPFRRYAFMAFHKFGVIGDSLSVGYTGNPFTEEPVNRNIMYSWPQFLARMSGNIALNFGFSGYSSKEWLSGQYGYTRFVDPDNLCQAYIVALGVNDQSELSLGTSADIGSTSADTFYRYYSDIIALINETAPNAKVFTFTMPYFGGDANSGFNDAIRYISENAGFSDVYLVDLEADYNDAFKYGYINSEKSASHYSCIGYANIASVLAGALSDTMNQNYDDFVSIPFLPYGSNDILD